MHPAIAHAEGEAKRFERSEQQSQNPADFLVQSLAQLGETQATNALVVIPMQVGNALEVLRRVRKQTAWLITREDESLLGLGEREGDFLAGASRCETLSQAEQTALREPTNRFTHPKALPALATRLPLIFAGLSFSVGTQAAHWEELREGRWTRPRWTYLSNGHEAVLAWCGDAAAARASNAIREELESIAQALTAQGKSTPALSPDTTPDDTRNYEALVQRGVQSITSGGLEKVVLARHVQRNLAEDEAPEDVLERLPNAGITRFFVRRGHTTFFGATPERLFQKRGTALLTEALAGTRKNGDDAQDAELTSSAKDHAEHAFVRDAIEATLTALGAKSIQASTPALRRAANLVHLKTTITAELPEATSAAALLEAFHPTPAVGGTPRMEAMQFIAQHEPSRGWYAGPIGWVDAQGDAEFYVALRSCVVTYGVARAYAGAGIVANSDPLAEARERSSSSRRCWLLCAEKPDELGAARGRFRDGPTLTDWSRVVARTLVDAGIRTLIASPGSRSTPFLIACLREPLLQVHHVLDERSAAFVALGAARVTAEPVAILATSGTAPAHWYPAIIEASLANVPLVFLSADRPTEQGFCGAAQTIDQTHLFGRHVRFFADPGNPEGTLAALLGLRRQLAQAISHARGPIPGPVHLNLRARKPLEPKPTSSPAADAALGQPLPKAHLHLGVDAESLVAAGELLDRAKRPLFVLGPIAPTEDVTSLCDLAEKIGAVVAAESTSQLRFGHKNKAIARFDSLDGWLRAGLFEAHPELEPDLVVQCGAEPTSAAYERWVARRKPIRIVLGTYTWNDPSGTAHIILRGALGETARALSVHATQDVKRDPWARAMSTRHAQITHALGEANTTWSEAEIARITLRSMPNHARLVLGNSLPIRMVDRYAHRGESIEVVHQRGANGIDGFLAQAFGATLVAPRKTVVLLGDCTFLHDVSSLLSLRRSTTPIVIVIVQNGGGRIFETLPVARAAPEALPFFVTEEEVDLASLGRAYGVHYARVDEGVELAQAIARGLETQGVSIVEAVVEAHGATKLDAMSDALFREHLSRV